MNAAANAKALGVPGGVTLALDIEAPTPMAGAASLYAYANAWTAQVEAAGYEAMTSWAQSLPADLTSDDLFFKVRARLYWRSDTDVPDVAHRGFCMRQSLPRPLGTIPVDPNIVMGDSLGGIPHWWMP
jgi:hypothetical protein